MGRIETRPGFGFNGSSHNADGVTATAKAGDIRRRLRLECQRRSRCASDHRVVNLSAAALETASAVRDHAAELPHPLSWRRWCGEMLVSPLQKRKCSPAAAIFADLFQTKCPDARRLVLINAQKPRFIRGALRIADSYARISLNTPCGQRSACRYAVRNEPAFMLQSRCCATRAVRPVEHGEPQRAGAREAMVAARGQVGLVISFRARRA